MSAQISPPTAAPEAGHDLAIRQLLPDHEAIRRLLPAYEAMVRETIDAVLQHVEGLATPRILDVGAGSGRFSAVAAARLPHARLTLIDADTRALSLAKSRLDRDLDRATFVHGSFADALPESDVIVASLALHHVVDAAKKRDVYANLRSAIATGGALVVCDAMIASDGRLGARTLERWTDHLVAGGDTPSEARARFVEWARNERYFSVEEELAFLRAAAFSSVDVAWRSGPLAVIVALP